MQQLVLDIGPPAEPDFDHTAAGPNGEAIARVRALAQGSLREAIVYLWGEPGSGRTHLLRAASRLNPALMVADDVEALDPAAQQQLFVAINAAREGGPAVLASGGQPPAQLTLREDLRTRLAWGLVDQLRPLSDEDKALHLRAQAARRGLPLSDEVLAYLLSRLPRDLASLNAVLEALDRYSLAAKRPVTVPLVREAMEKISSKRGGRATRG
ncbi:MAG: Sigma 54 interacting domain protein [Burkholderiales bacterium]|nr:Sigma 54 interacting domain protein [Burkholderiales bacterium]